MIGTLVTKYANYQYLEEHGEDDDISHQAAMMAIETRDEIEDRVNAILKSEGVTLAQLVLVMTR